MVIIKDTSEHLCFNMPTATTVKIGKRDCVQSVNDGIVEILP